MATYTERGVIAATDSELLARLTMTRFATVEWCGKLPNHPEQWTEEADRMFYRLTPDDVRAAANGPSLSAETLAEVIDMAISIACEPVDLPEGGIVGLTAVTPPNPIENR